MPNKETYDDWLDYPGLAMAETRSFFPHMSSDWETMVAQKRKEMKSAELADDVVCLQEWDGFCVDGMAQTTFMVSGEPAEHPQ